MCIDTSERKLRGTALRDIASSCTVSWKRLQESDDVKLCRFAYTDDPEASPRLGLVRAGAIQDVTSALDALPPLRWPVPPGDQLIAHLPGLRDAIERQADTAVPLDAAMVRLLAPVANPTKIVCGAGNWKEHKAPLGALGFMFKAVSALAGPGEGVRLQWPDRTTLHEPELAIVIGRECRNVTEGEALDHVAGYMCALDMTLERKMEDYAFCKSFDSYGMVGPWLVTADEVADPGDLEYRFYVNGALRGQRCFADLTGGPAALVAFASTAMTLYPGDIILSGAIDVAAISAGDVMTLEIPGLGTLETEVSIALDARSIGEAM